MRVMKGYTILHLFSNSRNSVEYKLSTSLINSLRIQGKSIFDPPP